MRLKQELIKRFGSAARTLVTSDDGSLRIYVRRPIFTEEVRKEIEDRVFAKHADRALRISGMGHRPRHKT